jgi:hypothetical protein
VQLPNALMFAAYNSEGGVQIAPDTADPFDSLDFPFAKYPYAFETFGNNGSTPFGASSTSAANHSLDDLTNTVPSAATVYTDLLESGTSSGATFVGSDHYPIVGDYAIVPTNIVVMPPATPVLIPQGFDMNGYFQFQLFSTSNTGFGILASTNLVDWTSIGSGTTDVNGLIFFQDTNAAGFPGRFYRANWPLP